MMALAESMAQRLPQSILCCWPLARVDHGPGGALLYGPSGRRIRCRHLILALPHSVLKAESVLFSPPLPAAKLAAQQRVKVSNAIKVWLTRIGLFDLILMPACVAHPSILSDLSAIRCRTLHVVLGPHRQARVESGLMCRSQHMYVQICQNGQ